MAGLAPPPGYRITDVAFDPLDPDRFAVAAMESATQRQAVLVFRNSAQRSRFDVGLTAAGATTLPGAISWSPDGTRVALAYAEIDAGGGAYRYRVLEWDVVADALSAVPRVAADARSGRAGETTRALVYADADAKLAVSDWGANAAAHATSPPAVDGPFFGHNVDADVTPAGNAMAWLERYLLTPQNLAWVYAVTGLGPTGHLRMPVRVAWPPATAVGLSSDARFLAVGMSGAILIVNLENLVPAMVIPAVDPRNLRFKPVPP